ncbi:MAG: nucleoside phosphorylase [Spirochaetaceae bacterium]|nr:nucleoside phosphorylase [Spirochaetaceae bacterium]
MIIPRFPEKFSSQPFFNPKDFLSYMEALGELGDRKAPDCVIIIYQKILYNYILSSRKTTPAKGYFGGTVSFIDDLEDFGEGRSLAIAANFGVGAPAAAVMIEELIAWGASKFIAIGYAGSLCEEVPPGSLVLCSKAFRDEGTSSHYIAGSEPALPSPELTTRLEKSLIALDMPFIKGATWTTDAIYRETPFEVVNYRRDGALVVEMEASALFSIGNFRNVEVAGCFSVSDTLAELAWRPEFHAETSRDGLARLFHAAIDAFR